jgi:hypothetical protein
MTNVEQAVNPTVSEFLHTHSISTPDVVSLDDLSGRAIELKSITDDVETDTEIEKFEQPEASDAVTLN